ncbi:MAG: sugar phosphate isomerase/epimerase family protein [Methanocellales archaeon]
MGIKVEVLVLASKFIYSNDYDLSNLAELKIQLSFYKKKQFFSIDHHQLKQRLKELDIEICSVHAPTIDVFDEDFLEVLRFIKNEYGVQLISIHPQRGDREKALARLGELAEDIIDLGVILAYENFPRSSNKWIASARDMFNTFNMQFLKLTYDTSHAIVEDSLSEVELCLSKIEIIHLSDQIKGDEHLPIGMGVYPVGELLSLLKRKQYSGYIVLEYMPWYEKLLREDVKKIEWILK